MAKERNDTPQRIDFELVKIIEKIREQEEKRNGIKPSFKTATAILAKRINEAGGIKE